MAKYSRFVDIKKTPSTINNFRMVTKEFEERAASLHRIVSYLAAKDALEMIQDGIPSGAEYKNLKNSLRLSEIGVGGSNRSAFAVHAPVKSKRVRKVDVPRTVIYVRAKKRLTRPDPAVQLLEDKGPWTADTIPFWPSSKEATVVQRKVTKKEADRVATEQLPKIDGIRAELLEMGKRIKKKKPGDAGSIKRNGKAIPDIAMQALDMEFGGGGGKSSPVFRKMIQSITKNTRRMSSRHRIIKDAMLNPNSKRYKSFVPKGKKIGKGEAVKFMGFQKRLGR